MFPCLTTPAENEEGRPAPKKRKRSESPGTMERWRTANRRWPPWQFRSTALVREEGDWQVPTAKTREWLQGFPANYTARLIGNAWHVSVAKFLLFCALLADGAVQATAAAPAPWHSACPDPTLGLRWHPDGGRPLQRAASWWRRAGILWDPKPPAQPDVQSPETCEKLHFQWAQSASLDAWGPAAPNQCWLWCYDMHRCQGGGTHFAKEIVWLQGAPAHVQALYGHNTGVTKLHVLVVAHLLKWLQFPQWQTMISDLFWRFPMMGPLTPGVGWEPRRDLKYSRPRTFSEFSAAARPCCCR